MSRALFVLAFFVLSLSAAVDSDAAAFLKAVQEENVTAVRALVSAGTNANSTFDSSGSYVTALFYAVKSQNLPILICLLANGADPDRPVAWDMEYSETAVGLAWGLGNETLLELLLLAGVDRGELNRLNRERLLGLLQSENDVAARQAVLSGKAKVDAALEFQMLYAGRSARVRQFIHEEGARELVEGRVNLLDTLLSQGIDSSTGSKASGYLWPDENHVWFEFPIATSFLHDEKKPLAYSPDRAFDGDQTTSWAEGVEGPGIGQKLAFQVPADARSISILPGYGVEKFFKQNNRVRRASLSLYTLDTQLGANTGATFISLKLVDTGARLELECSDRMVLQDFPLAVPVEAKASGRKIYAVLEIKDIYPGTAWNDTCIAEIKLR